MNAVLPGTEIAVDQDGYLRHLEDWSPAVATQLAALQGLSLQDSHWRVLQAARDFYARYQRSPATRPLLKFLAQELGPEQATSIYLMRLFGGGTAALTIARLAGLPKPPNCF